jgi:hypothetical protein
MRAVLATGPLGISFVSVVTSGSVCFAGILKSALRRRSNLPNAPYISGFLVPILKGRYYTNLFSATVPFKLIKKASTYFAFSAGT